jgi:hypothetical protein
MHALLQRHKRYTALLNIAGQFPTPTPCYQAVDEIQAARFAINDWSAISDVLAIKAVGGPGELLA